MGDLFSWAEDVRTAEHPPGIPDHIRELFEHLAFRVIATGRRRYSARAILHRIRWEHEIEYGDTDFKVNNNYSARLARWFMAKHPHTAGFFELRERHDEEDSE